MVFTITYTNGDVETVKAFIPVVHTASSDESLQSALKNAESGDTVAVDSGNYTLPTLKDKQGVTIVGVDDGSTVIGGENTETGYSSNFGKDTTIKNVTFSGTTSGVRWSYANGGTSTFENCTFKGDSTYGFHIDQSNGATFIFNNCTFIGFNAFAGDLEKVIFNNCTFLSNGNYGHTNIWSTGEFNGCTFGDNTSVSPAGNSAHLFFDGVEESYHHEFIGSVESMLAFAKSVNEDGDSWKGQAVILLADIDLANVAWTPIGNTVTKFEGTFDGKDHTIKNLTINTPDKSNVGLFGYTVGGEIKNLTVENANVTGYLNVGVVAGTPYTSKYTNISVVGHVEVKGFAYVGTVGGKNAYADWTDIVVDVDDTSYVKADSVQYDPESEYADANGNVAYRTYVGGVVGFMGEGTHKFTNVTSNIDVFGSTCDVGGIVGIAHEGNSFINCSTSGNVTVTKASDASEAEEMGGIAGVWMDNGRDVTFEGCSFTGKLTVNFTEGIDLSDNTIYGAAYNGSDKQPIVK